MEKRTLIAFVLAMLVIVGYFAFVTKRYPSPAPQMAEQPVKVFKKQTVPVERREIFPQTQPLANEKVITYNTEKYEVLISNIGGAIKGINLKGYSGVDAEKLTKLAEVVDSAGMLSLIEMQGEDLRGAIYQVTKEQNAVFCRYRIPERFEIIKRYYFSADQYHIELEVTIKNLALQTEEYQYRIVGAAGVEIGGRLDKRFVELDTMINGELKRDSMRKVGKNGLLHAGEISWTGIKNKYFSVILKPFPSTKASFYSVVGQGKLETVMEITPFFIPPDSSVTHKFLLYAGPNDYDILKSYNFRFEEIINYGLFGGISKVLLTTLKFFHRLAGNWGVAIILLTITVSLLLYPFTWKSMKSMKEMQAIQPEITKLREEHKSNPQKLNKATMELYRKHKINPLGGCLPMLFQMPIFIALYQALIRSIELKGAHFLWIKDLSLADALPLPFSLPVLGNSINILPLLMSAAMFLQQKISQPGGHAQTEQQKQMAIFMPILFGFIFYGLPSGLVLYWLTNTTLMVVYQSIIKKGHL